MPEAVLLDYEGSSEGAVRHWEIPYARLEDTTPTVGNPAAVLADASSIDQVCGVILSIDAADSVAVIDFTCSMVYRFLCRTATGYNGAAENAWSTIAIGDFVYYDRSGLIAGIYLSCSALDNAGAANPFFGHVVPLHDTDMALYAKGTGLTPGSSETIGVMIRGAGAG